MTVHIKTRKEKLECHADSLHWLSLCMKMAQTYKPSKSYLDAQEDLTPQRNTPVKATSLHVHAHTC